MKKYQPILFLWLTLIGSAFSLFSPQVAAELKIGFVNALKLMDTAPQVKSANKRLEDEFAPRQRRLVTARQDIKNLEERLMRNAATMTDAEAKDLSYKIRDKKREFQREQREFGEDYNLRRNEELNQVQKAIVKTIQKFAEQEKYDLILSEGVVWASKQVDITDQVLQRLKNENRRKKR